MEIPIFETVLGALEVRGSIAGIRHDLEEVFELHRRGPVEYEERHLHEVNDAIEQVLDGTPGRRGSCSASPRAAGALETDAAVVSA